MGDLFYLIFFSAAGAFCILASILNWNFFFNNSRARPFVKFLGRNGARVFYALLGLFLMFAGYMSQG